MAGAPMHGLRANGTYCLRANGTYCLRANGTYCLRANGTTPWLAPSPRHNATAITDAAATVNRMANRISRIHLRRLGWEVCWRRSESFSIAETSA
jgi:hypothetical protein